MKIYKTRRRKKVELSTSYPQRRAALIHKLSTGESEPVDKCAECDRDAMPRHQYCYECNRRERR